VKRRNLVVAAAGALAAAGGFGAAWWLPRRDAAPSSLWTLELPKPGGGTLALASLRGRPLLVNFWATWCVPCVIEMPLLERFYESRRAEGWQVVGIAVDQETPVAKFVEAKGIRFPVVLGGTSALDLSRALGNDAGGLPFSAAIARDGSILGRRLGAVDDGILHDWANASG